MGKYNFPETGLSAFSQREFPFVVILKNHADLEWEGCTKLVHKVVTGGNKDYFFHLPGRSHSYSWMHVNLITNYLSILPN